ncbi:hypothetical protein ACFP67_14125 [Mammaliicoccus sciuri]|uniref:hypothetical protein n=1 Tax=Mammaliicoccus sciuri TaxID=1296 RepID=UPI000CD15413|nr:hypothetical protein [Mammaliicoccus sciuri]PNZ29996.1 hypothetical protein CD114_01195 [Mammaliicoccus sciuri]
MTTYLVIAVIVLSLLSIVLAVFNMFDQSQRRKDLEESYARIQAHNNKLISELNSIQNRIQTNAVYEFRIKAYEEFSDWERKHGQIKYCRNCLSDDIENVYLEVEYGIPEKALKRCRACGETIAEYKSKEI